MKIGSVTFVLLAGFSPALGFNNYLDSVGGGGAPKKASFAPVGKPMAVPSSGTGGYLDNMAGASAATPPPPPPPPPVAPPAPPAAPAAAAAAPAASTAPTAGDYLSSLPVAAAPSGGGVPGYLDALPQSAAVSGSGVQGYLDAIAPASGGGFAPKPAFAPPAAAASAAPAASADGEETLIAQEPVLTAINQLNDNMVRNQELTISVLGDISKSVKALADKTI
ncbi:expressed unknown protein [Seminavis robusta]|uniref:Uncharacterized protein n=1 Tax=Seminavis robusta TaxID=568900 RepID=A0A9N8EQK2_9STRA|nr:expressed unknown protein [Seminavis robusta]|eukprot:Sro1673_g290300.1 n/a (222) ;mRNA; f:21867-22532